MKKITATLALCLLAGAAYAGPVSRSQALRIAQSHFQTTRSTRSVGQSPETLTLAYECTPKASRSASLAAQPLYYVFNKGEQQGYVIVSGDDCIETVLGYTDNGQFNIKEVNSGLRWWLDAVAAKVAKVQGQKRIAALPKKKDLDLKSYVEPLITTRWARHTPYNMLCPTDEVHDKNSRMSWSSLDIALAQILNYWNGKLDPAGKVDYVNADNVPVLADLDDFDIKWGELRDECHEYPKASEEEVKKVSELIFASSLALETNLCIYGSTNNLINVKKLEERFRIDDNCDLYPRYYFSDNEWNKLIKTELSAGRPVIYQGAVMDNIRSFVCDGYNEEGLFHVNWGEYGNNDGYFQLSMLDGDYNVNEEYTNGRKSVNKDQCIVCGIQPKKAFSPISQNIYFNEIADNGTGGDKIKANVFYITNFGNPFKGSLNLGAYDENNQFVCALDEDALVDIAEDQVSEVASWDVAVGNKLKDGTYTIRPVYRVGNGDYLFIRGRQSAPYNPYITIGVKNNKVKLLSNDELNHQVQVIGIWSEHEVCYEGGKMELGVAFSNKGANYNGPVVLTQTIDGQEYLVYENTVNIKKDEKTTIKALLQLSEGKDKDSITVWIGDKLNDYKYGNDYPATPMASFDIPLVAPTPGTPDLEMLEYRCTPEAVTNKDEYVTVNFTLTNKGGTYNELLRFDTYSATRGGRARLMTNKLVSIDKGDTTKVSVKIPTKDLMNDVYGVFPISFIDNKSIEVNPTGTWFCFDKYSDNISIRIPETGCTVFNPLVSIKVPEGVQCGVVTGIKDNVLLVDYRYQSGDVVPAYTPVIAVSETAGEYFAPCVESKQLPATDNLLRNERDYLYYTNYGNGDYVYYFYNEQQNGFFLSQSAFIIQANHGYLALPKNKEYADAYLIPAVTGVEDVTLNPVTDENAPVYTLSGVRVNCKVSELPKGLYIINGKKVVIP